MNLHVGNLAPSLREGDLRVLFEPYGSVKTVDVVSNMRTGEPLGYGFVVMGSESEGEKAIAALNGKEVNGRPITVSKANRPNGPRRKSFTPRPRRDR